MTDKLKCPFCGEELEEFGGGDFPLLHYCDNTNCNLYHIMGQYTLWRALIDGKKAQDALKVAIKGIKEIESDNERGLGEGGGLYSDDTPFEELLNQITSITKQGE